MIYSKDDIRLNNGRKFYVGKIYPNIPYSETDDYLIATIGDRLDTLAYKYYGNIDMWKIISIANNNVTKGSLYITPGTQIRIPTNLADVIKLYEQLNKSR
jgi:phage tail protein X